MKTCVVYFWIALSTGIVCLVTETGKQVVAEPGAMKETETWSRGIFKQCVKTWMVYVRMVPSIVVVFETGKLVMTEPGSIREAETWPRRIFLQCVKT